MKNANRHPEPNENRRNIDKESTGTHEVTSFKTSSPNKKQNQPNPKAPVRPVREEKATSDILYIGDSISGNAHFTVLEEATKSKFVKVKAYGSVRDSVKNVAKNSSKIPAANFAEVVPTQLRKQKYKTMVIQSGSTDITNLNTKENPEEHIEYFKDVAIGSATNLFSVVRNLKQIHHCARL